jgi:hypothetical protein
VDPTGLHLPLSELKKIDHHQNMTQSLYATEENSERDARKSLTNFARKDLTIPGIPGKESMALKCPWAKKKSLM